jgi:hypothetical protein
MTDQIISLIDADNILRMRTIGGDADWSPPEGYTAIEADGQIGQRWNGSAFQDVPVVLPVPSTISRRQCARGMLARSLISGAEALAMTQTGAMPALVDAMVSGQPDETLIRIDFAADTYERGNPLLNQLMTGAGYSPVEIDDFFREAAAL